MFKLTIGTNTTRKQVIIDRETTIRKALSDNSISYDKGIIFFEGNTLKAGDLDKTFAALNVGETAVLNVMLKVDNA